MDWRIKGAIQKVLGYVPGGDHVHFLLQRSVGGLASFIGECDSKVEDWRLMMGHLRASKIALAGLTLLEMGTGWYPTFPFCLYLGGAARVHTLDLSRHMRPALVAQLARRLAEHVGVIARESGRDPAMIAAQQTALATAIERGVSLDAATAGVVDYRAPADAAHTGLPDASVDVVFSNSVLEHVPGDVIEACFREAIRILRPGGIIFHSINCGDHYAYVDRSINQLHYLQYSRSEWERWNNSFLYQNRLRAADFTDMASRAGFAIEIDTSRAKKERLDELARIEIDPSFAHYPREQLAITSIDFVGRKPRP